MGTPEQELKTLLLSEEIDLLERLRRRLQELELRVGDDTRLQHTISTVIVDALAEAGVQDHQRLARVISPMIVASIRQEIANSKDVMVDALYPITGRLVTTAVRRAFRDLMENVNARLTNALTLEVLRVRLQAKLTGRPEAQIWLERRGFFIAEEAYLIDAQSGILLAHAVRGEAPDTPIDEDLVAGMLSAIMSFSQDAFAQNPESLRRLEFEGSDLLICRSPAYLLAIRIAGTPPVGVEDEVEAVFRAFVDRWRDRLVPGMPDEDRLRVMNDLREELDNLSRVERKTSRRPLLAYGLLGMALIGLISWYTWGVLRDLEVADVMVEAEAVIKAQPALRAYPIEVSYDPDKNLLTAFGLAPDSTMPGQLHDALQAAFPDKQVSVDLTPLPTSGVEPYQELLGELAADRQDPVRRLRAWAHNNAIFFGDGTTFRDPRGAAEKLDALAVLMLAQPPDVVLRIAGYGDLLGSDPVNRTLTVDRAQAVADQLVARGVDRDRLAPVGRARLHQLSDIEGPGSPNRRVEFEVGFVGERGSRS